MTHFGLEKEYFLVHKETGVPIMPESLKLNLPIDSCGYLVEARGKPYNNMYDAVSSLLADEQRILHKLKGSEYVLSNEPVMKLTRAFLHDVSKKYVKGLTKYSNYLGYPNHKITMLERTSGIHLSVTNKHEYEVIRTHPANSGYSKIAYYQNFDWPSLFTYLDKHFTEEIKAAKRNKGFYEVKPDGRVEYRSLPCNIDLNKLRDIVQEFYKS